MNTQHQPWMRRVLKCAAAYNILWGSFAILLPVQSLRLSGFDPLPTYPQLWQCIGMIVGVYGVGYWIAAGNPFRHWPIVLVGLLGKLFGPIGVAWHVFNGTLPSGMFWTTLFNDAIWWIPFAFILWRSVIHHQAANTAHASEDFDDPVRELVANTGDNLLDLSMRQPQLVVLLRHAGCTFCREALADLGRKRDEIESKGCGIVLVHLGSNDRSQRFFDKYGLGDVPRISDPRCRLYRQFGLDLGDFQQLFGLRVWIRGFIAGILNGHGIGRLEGNGFQMPGAFVLSCGEFVDGFRHESASDRPDYLGLVESVEHECEPVLA